MKNITGRLTLILVIFFIVTDISHAVNPTFELTSTPQIWTTSNEGFFDIVLKQTDTSVFAYTFGEYALTLDPIFDNNFSFSVDTATSGSTYQNKIPQQYINNFIRSGLILYFRASGIPPGSEPIISQTTGTLVTRVKFINSDLYERICFQGFTPYVAWRTSGTPSTKIFALVNSVSTQLPNSENIFTVNNCSSLHLCCLSAPPVPPARISPPNNSFNVGAPFMFIWNRGTFYPGIVYRIQVSEDSLFNSLTVDSAFQSDENPVIFASDKINYNSTYFWRVRKGYFGDYTRMGAYTEPWKFTTTSAVSCNLKIIPEGYYTLPTHPAFEVKAYLRNNTSPFALIDSADAYVPDSSWSGLFNFVNAVSGNYYIVVKHFNTIETWSSSGGESLTKGITNTYDFSSSISQAFGNNLKHVGGAYCIFSGDVNQNGYVDGDDVLIINNELANFTVGNLPSDINGDGFCDLTDLLIAYDNSVNFVSLIRP